MKDKFENIEDLFKDSFEHFEVDVDPTIWSNINAKLSAQSGTPDASSGGQSGISGANVSTGSGMLKIAAIAGTAGLLTIGSYFYFAGGDEDSTPNEENRVEVLTKEPNKELDKIEPEQTKAVELDEVGNIDLVNKKTTVAKEEKSNKGVVSNVEPLVESKFEKASETIGDKENSEKVVSTEQANQKKSQSKSELSQHSASDATVVHESAEKEVFQAAIYASTKTGVYPLNVVFENKGSIGSVTYWKLGDGATYRNEDRVEHTFEKSGNFWVVLEIRNNNGNKSKDSVLIIVSGKSKISAPNTFTPNGDGINDAFVIETEHIEKIKCRIVDRNQNLVFEWNNIYGHWDGRNMTGEIVDKGTYFFIIEATDSDGNPVKPIKGTVTLFR